MANSEEKIEQYFLENLKILSSLNNLSIKDTPKNKYIFSDEVYDFISPLLSNYHSFSILKKMLFEYVYDINVSKAEKEYFLNKLYNHLGKLEKHPYIDVPDFIDRKSLIAFAEEFNFTIHGFLVGFISEENIQDEKFRSECIKAIKENPEAVTILFIRENLDRFSYKNQIEIATRTKKYLRRMLSFQLVYPIIDLNNFLMQTAKNDFLKQISRESIIENFESDIIEVCARILERKQENKKEDEINDYMADLLRSKGYNVSDQTRSGVSMTKMNSGEIDLMVRDERNLPITILECLKLSRISAKGKNENLIKHISKLIDNYDGLGLSSKYLIIYSFSNDFEKFKQNYKMFFSSLKRNDSLKYIKLDSLGFMRNPFGKDVSNLVSFSTFHRINGVYQKINHFLLNLKK